MLIYSIVFYQIFTRRCSLYSVLSYLGCPVLPVLSWLLSCPGSPSLTILSWQFLLAVLFLEKGCLLLTFLFCFLFLIVSSWFSCPSQSFPVSPIVAVLPSCYFSSWPLLAFLSKLSFQYFYLLVSFPRCLSWFSIPDNPVLSCSDLAGSFLAALFKQSCFGRELHVGV